jgi:hypothetical protein
MSHRIRLGPPWTVAVAGGRSRHARKFGWPATLDPHERVWLVCDAVPGPGEVSVNGQPVGTATAAGPFAADITPLLAPRNELVIATASADELGPVGLEIRIADSGPG